MARTAGWGAGNGAFHLNVQRRCYPPVTAFIWTLVCGLCRLWKFYSCASPWSEKLITVRAWLWVSPLGSRGLKLKSKEAWSWRPQWWGITVSAQITLSQLQLLLPREMYPGDSYRSSSQEGPCKASAFSGHAHNLTPLAGNTFRAGTLWAQHLWQLTSVISG